MKNLLILVNRLRNDINGNHVFQLQAVNQDGMICNYALNNAGYKLNKQDIYKTKQDYETIAQKIQKANKDYNIILVKF